MEVRKIKNKLIKIVMIMIVSLQLSSQLRPMEKMVDMTKTFLPALLELVDNIKEGVQKASNSDEKMEVFVDGINVAAELIEKKGKEKNGLARMGSGFSLSNSLFTPLLQILKDYFISNIDSDNLKKAVRNLGIKIKLYKRKASHKVDEGAYALFCGELGFIPFYNEVIAGRSLALPPIVSKLKEVANSLGRWRRWMRRGVMGVVARNWAIVGPLLFLANYGIYFYLSSPQPQLDGQCVDSRKELGECWKQKIFAGIWPYFEPDCVNMVK